MHNRWFTREIDYIKAVYPEMYKRFENSKPYNYSEIRIPTLISVCIGADFEQYFDFYCIRLMKEYKKYYVVAYKDNIEYDYIAKASAIFLVLRELKDLKFEDFELNTQFDNSSVYYIDRCKNQRSIDREEKLKRILE